MLQWATVGDHVLAAVPVVVAVVVVIAALRPVVPGDVDRWAARFGVTVSQAARGVVAAGLRRNRVRGLAVAVGLLVAGAPAFVNLVARSRAGDVAVAVRLGWLLAPAATVLLAEVVAVPRPSSPAGASLRRRDPGELVGGVVVAAIHAAAGLAVVTAVASVAAGDANRAEAALAGVVAAVAAVVAEWGLRRIAVRPAWSDDLAPVDRAFRADGAHQVAGAEAAIVGSALPVAADPFLSTAAPGLAAPFAVASLAGLAVWVALAAYVPWRSTSDITPAAP